MARYAFIFDNEWVIVKNDWKEVAKQAAKELGIPKLTGKDFKKALQLEKPHPYLVEHAQSKPFSLYSDPSIEDRLKGHTSDILPYDSIMSSLLFSPESSHFLDYNVTLIIFF